MSLKNIYRVFFAAKLCCVWPIVCSPPEGSVGGANQRPNFQRKPIFDSKVISDFVKMSLKNGGRWSWVADGTENGLHFPVEIFRKSVLIFE